MIYNKMENKEEVFFEVGMEVWDLVRGRGKVSQIRVNLNIKYPVTVQFESHAYAYTHDGRISIGTEVALFQTKPIITPNKPLVRFKAGELVWVSDDTIEWDARFFSHKVDNGFRCFVAQQKQGATNTWAYIRKFNDNPLLP